ncbi:MAG: ATP-dependent protease subunit HslV [Bdellovibrionales bacterium]|nr:ATP-dependent protease subunit HslV [Bdellovibrionales bacterium]
MPQEFHSTTILAIRRSNSLVMIGDGQVTLNNTVFKQGAKKVRTMQQGEILAGFAGSAADSFTLFERFEGKLSAHGGQLSRAAVELAKDWRMDRALRRLEAMLIVGDAENLYLLSGMGDVIEPDDGVLAIGSGGNFALAAARALLRNEQSSSLPLRTIAEQAMTVAAEICPFTNSHFNIEEVTKNDK